MSLPALEDINVEIDGVIRVETSPKEKATPIIMEMMRSGGGRGRPFEAEWNNMAKRERIVVEAE